MMTQNAAVTAGKLYKGVFGRMATAPIGPLPSV
jgi:hypothetical protein